MKLYNSLIVSAETRLSAAALREYPYCPDRAWAETAGFEMVMQRDAAYELGGSGKPSVGFTCVTTDPGLVGRDEILVYGKDLGELQQDAPYARIALVLVGDIESDDDDTTQTLSAIQAIDFVKYHVYPKGFMMRASGQTHREQVRISREAVQQGISFAAVGSSFLRKYHQDANVRAVKLIFVTDPAVDFAGLQADAQSARSITQSLSKIMEGLPTDCGSCALKPVCDEVEGMKELHFGKESHTTE